MVGIRLEGPEDEVLDIIETLENAGLAHSVSKLYANRRNEDEIRVYAKISNIYRFMDALKDEIDTYKDTVFGNGAAGWYACVRYKLDGGGTKDTPRNGPFETEQEARIHAVTTAKVLRKQGKECFEIWELCDSHGIPIDLASGLV